MTTTEMKQAVRVHELKYWPDFFKKTVNGKKTFEVRWNDRNYMLGDVLFHEDHVRGRTFNTAARSRSAKNDRAASHATGFPSRWQTRS